MADGKAADKSLKNDPVDFSFLRTDETQTQKLKRKVKENPLVPIGNYNSNFLVCIFFVFFS